MNNQKQLSLAISNNNGNLTYATTTIKNNSNESSESQSINDKLNELNKFFTNSETADDKPSTEDLPDYTGGSNKGTNGHVLKKYPQLHTPKEVKEYLDRYVIGQEHAKKVLSVAAFNHQRRVNGLNTKKSNILLVGPSGSGKTYLIEKLSEILCVPIAYADATTLTQAGYVGEDVDSILANLYYKANNNLDLAEVGIVFIDEFDKIQRHKSNSSSLDVGGVGVQQALLKMLEGTTIDVKLDAQKSKVVRMNTKNILFICAGAFVGIERVIKARVQPNKRRIGFSDENFTASEENNDFNKLLPKVNSDDIINFGFIPEIMGRIPLVAGLEKLSEDDLVNILTNTKDNLIDEFGSNFNYPNKNYQLVFTKQSIKEIAHLAIKREVGARGLRSIFENLLLDAMYEVPSFINGNDEQNNIKAILITKDNVKNNTSLNYLTKSIDEQELLDESSKSFKELITKFKYLTENNSKKSTAVKSTKKQTHKNTKSSPKK